MITVDTGSNISVVQPDLRSGEGTNGAVHWAQELCVADVQEQFILGLDYLHPNGCQVTLRDQLLTIGKHQIPLKRSSVSTNPRLL